MLKLILRIILSVFFSHQFAFPGSLNYSLSYNLIRPGFEGRINFKQNGFVSLNPILIVEGRSDENDSLFMPNLHKDQQYGIYAHFGILSFTNFAAVSAKAGVTISNVLSFSNLYYYSSIGMRFHHIINDHWLLEGSTFPIQYSYRTFRKESNFDMFTFNRFNLGFGFIF